MPQHKNILKLFHRSTETNSQEFYIKIQKDLDDSIYRKKSFPGWSKTPRKERVQVFFFRYKNLLEETFTGIGGIMFGRKWKNSTESTAEIENVSSYRVCYFPCTPQLVTGEILEVSKGVECRTERACLWIVVTSIVPFGTSMV